MQTVVAPLWVRITFPVIEIVEIIAIYFGFGYLTGLPGWIGAAICTYLLFFLKLTFVPLITVPLAIVGAYFVGKLPLLLVIAFFCSPYVYKWNFIRVHQNRLKQMYKICTLMAFGSLLSACTTSVMAIKTQCENQYHHFSSQVICTDNGFKKDIRYTQDPYVQNFVRKGYELDSLVHQKKITEEQAKSAWMDVLIEQRNAYNQNQSQLARQQVFQNAVNDTQCQWNGVGYSPETMAVLTPQAYQAKIAYCQQRLHAAQIAAGLNTGECPYPDSLDHNGNRCGDRSSYSRPGGQ